MNEFTLTYSVKYRDDICNNALVTVLVKHYQVQKPMGKAASNDWEANGYTDFDFDIVKVELFDEKGASIILEGEALENVAPLCEYELAFIVEGLVIEYLEDMENV